MAFGGAVREMELQFGGPEFKLPTLTASWICSW